MFNHIKIYNPEKCDLKSVEKNFNSMSCSLLRCISPNIKNN